MVCHRVMLNFIDGSTGIIVEDLYLKGKRFMKLAVMQPYFFPYIGYWQLMNAVDTYVIFDDVNFINRGWVNRNKILFGGKTRYINLPLLGASQNKLINEVKVNKEKKEMKRVMSIIKEAYRKAPFFDEVYPVVKEILNSEADTVSTFIADSFRFMCLYLGIGTERFMSSNIDKDTSLKGEDKIIDICEKLGADHYINAIGGIGLYHAYKFKEHGMELSFLKTEEKVYKQFGNDFVGNLSIIDVMMFNSREDVRWMLNKYALVPALDSGGVFQKAKITCFLYHAAGTEEVAA